MNTVFKFTVRILIIKVLFLFSYQSHAQVTIGAATPPQEYSTLELVSNGKAGLRLPQLTTAERNALDLQPIYWQLMD